MRMKPIWVTNWCLLRPLHAHRPRLGDRGPVIRSCLGQTVESSCSLGFSQAATLRGEADQGHCHQKLLMFSSHLYRPRLGLTWNSASRSLARVWPRGDSLPVLHKNTLSTVHTSQTSSCQKVRKRSFQSLLYACPSPSHSASSPRAGTRRSSLLNYFCEFIHFPHSLSSVGRPSGGWGPPQVQAAKRILLSTENFKTSAYYCHF